MTASDEVTLIAGVRMDRTSSAAIIAEFGPNTGSTNGAFIMSGPETTGASGPYGWSVRGTSVGGTNSDSRAAPDTSVITGTADISAPLRIIRRNGVQRSSSTASLGTGAFSTQSLHIGRRNNATLPFKGRIYGLIVINRVLAMAEEWMAAKAGVAL